MNGNPLNAFMCPVEAEISISDALSYVPSLGTPTWGEKENLSKKRQIWFLWADCKLLAYVCSCEISMDDHGAP